MQCLSLLTLRHLRNVLHGVQRDDRIKVTPNTSRLKIQLIQLIELYHIRDMLTNQLIEPGRKMVLLLSSERSVSSTVKKRKRKRKH